MHADNILTINAGSSSIKLDLFSIDDTGSVIKRKLAASTIGIGLPNASFTITPQSGEKQTQKIEVTDHAAAINVLIGWLRQAVPADAITAIGHRIVHGGSRHSQPELITETLKQDLQALLSFDPEHLPVALQLIDALGKEFPAIPQVASFDTAFFHAMPRVAQILPLPRKYQDEGLRRYGFHGLSYTYLQSAFRNLAGDQAVNGRVIYAHLGSGASVAATLGGKPIDTTMGFTPASGIMMSSRSGDIDPGIAWYLRRQHSVSSEEFNNIVNFQSGLLGVSEMSADMYTLIQNEKTSVPAAEAIELFVYQVKKTIGAFTAALGGLDSIVFSGGIGEQSAVLRERICDGFGYLGIELDRELNEKAADLISAPTSHVGVHVIPTDEASIIAEQAIKIVRNSNPEGQKHGIS